MKKKLWKHTLMQEQSHHHTNLKTNNAGLFISMERPYIGTSPDAIVTCDGLGKVVEIKCHIVSKTKSLMKISPNFL